MNAEPLLRSQVDRLSIIFQQAFGKGEVLDLRPRFLAFTTDTVALHTLGHSMGLQDDETRAEDWNRTIRAVAKLTPLLKHFPWMIGFVQKLPVNLVRVIMPDLARLLQLHCVCVCCVF